MKAAVDTMTIRPRVNVCVCVCDAADRVYASTRIAAKAPALQSLDDRRPNRTNSRCAIIKLQIRNSAGWGTHHQGSRKHELVPALMEICLTYSSRFCGTEKARWFLLTTLTCFSGTWSRLASGVGAFLEPNVLRETHEKSSWNKQSNSLTQVKRRNLQVWDFTSRSNSTVCTELWIQSTN